MTTRRNREYLKVQLLETQRMLALMGDHPIMSASLRNKETELQEKLEKIHIVIRTELEAKKLLLSTPGDTIQETIDKKGMSQAELAERLGMSVPELAELIKGKVPITKETATKLEYVLGIPASFWLNLERQYQDELLEIEQMIILEQGTK